MKRHTINNKKKKGFTLIEIMVAVAIMLVLMGFLVPKLSGYRAKAMEAKAINTGKQIYSAAMTSYSMTNGEFKPTDVGNVITDTLVLQIQQFQQETQLTKLPLNIHQILKIILLA